MAKKPLPILIVKRASILLFILCFLAAFFWTVGSFRSFLEETQLMLLGLLRWASLCLVVASGIGIALSLLYLLLKRHAAAPQGFIGYVLLVAFGVLGLVLSDALVALSQGLP
jgi:hypothetical protein